MVLSTKYNLQKKWNSYEIFTKLNVIKEAGKLCKVGSHQKALHDDIQTNKKTHKKEQPKKRRLKRENSSEEVTNQ